VKGGAWPQCFWNTNKNWQEQQKTEEKSKQFSKVWAWQKVFGISKSFANR